MCTTRFNMILFLAAAVLLVGCNAPQPYNTPLPTLTAAPLALVSLKDFFPALQDLPGDVRPGGGGGGDATRRGINFELESEHSLQQLHDHYSHQLLKAGWLLQMQNIKKHSAVSNWQVRDVNGQNWSAIMVINDKPHSSENDFMLEITAELSP